MGGAAVILLSKTGARGKQYANLFSGPRKPCH
jgi:hypothetical protein